MKPFVVVCILLQIVAFPVLLVASPLADVQATLDLRFWTLL